MDPVKVVWLTAVLSAGIGIPVGMNLPAEDSSTYPQSALVITPQQPTKLSGTLGLKGSMNTQMQSFSTTKLKPLTTKPLKREVKSPSRSNWYKSTNVTIRSYCPCKICCGKWADGHVAWNNKYAYPDDKYVAISPDLEKTWNIKLGDMIHFTGLGWYTIGDRTRDDRRNQFEILFTRGNARYQNRHTAATYFPTTKVGLFRTEKGTLVIRQHYGDKKMNKKLNWMTWPWVQVKQ